MSKTDARRGSVVLAIVVTVGLITLGVRPAAAEVTAVKGSASGYMSTIGLFGGAPSQRGPADTPGCGRPNPPHASTTEACSPSVTLPVAGGSVTESEPGPIFARYGPADIFSSDRQEVSSEGTTGADGSVTSTATLQNLDRSDSEAFSATTVTSTCTAAESGVSGSTTITGGSLVLSEGDPDVEGDEVVETLPTNPAPGLKFTGTVQVGDTFEYIFNEQITNPDGSITVYAAHQRLLGPNAIGDLYIGKVECGVTASGGGTTTSTGGGVTTSSTSGPGTTTSTAPPGTTTTSPSDTTTTVAGGGASGGVTEVGGGAFGFSTSISLFGGPPATRGPEPVVTLPAGGSATPISASAASGEAEYGPAIIFSSGPLDVSTQGTTGADGSVTSSAKVQNTNQSKSEVVTATALESTCTASASGQTGSTKSTNGKLTVSLGPSIDDDADDVVVDLPAEPAPNSTFEGKVEDVGDSFRVIVNEQVTAPGSITVNAVHMVLLGPSAKGDLYIGQSRCAINPTAGSGGTGGQNALGAANRGGVAKTGSEVARLVELALALVALGWSGTLWARRRLAGATDGNGLP